MKAVEIKWDIDTKEDLEFLPKEIEIPEGMTDEEEISDYISDLTGFCHKGFMIKDNKLRMEGYSFDGSNCGG